MVGHTEVICKAQVPYQGEVGRDLPEVEFSIVFSHRFTHIFVLIPFYHFKDKVCYVKNYYNPFITCWSSMMNSTLSRFLVDKYK